MTRVISPHQTALEITLVEQLTDDVAQIVQRVPFLERAPTRMWTPGLVSELEAAADRLVVLAGHIQEAAGDR